RKTTMSDFRSIAPLALFSGVSLQEAEDIKQEDIAVPCNGMKLLNPALETVMSSAVLLLGFGGSGTLLVIPPHKDEPIFRSTTGLMNSFITTILTVPDTVSFLVAMVARRP
ncbi:MAG: hypothetical protein QW104_05845, partial [Nitrososphaerota archaeon]